MQSVVMPTVAAVAVPAHAQEITFGQRPLDALPSLTPEQRAFVRATVNEHLEKVWSEFITLAPSASQQIKGDISSEFFSVPLVRGGEQQYSLSFTTNVTDSHLSGFAVNWVDNYYFPVERNHALARKRLCDRFASVIANIITQGYRWD